MAITAHRESVAHSSKKQSRGARRVPLWQRALLGAIVPVIAIALWEIFARSAESLYFPPPSEIAVRMYELWLSGPLPWVFTDAVRADILPSLGRMLGGWALAGVLGIMFGVLIGRSRRVAYATSPLLNFLRSVPGPALIPVFLVILGTDSTMRVSLIAFGCVWPILLNTIDGVRAVEPTQLETARAFGLPLRARIFRIVIPAAMPKIFAGLSVALAIALVLMVISELTVATDGIGYRIQRAQQLFALTDLWAGIILIAILGYLLTLIFSLVERWALAWYRGSRRLDD